MALTEKRIIPEVIVVEGKDDTANLRRFYEVDTYETRGSAIDQDDLERIAILQELRGVIVFTDPDYNGERIRKVIMQEIPQAKHAFLNRGEAVPKSKTKGRSLGVEHASFEDLEKALSLNRSNNPIFYLYLFFNNWPSFLRLGPNKFQTTPSV